jgi:hypothetical protein
MVHATMPRTESESVRFQARTRAKPVRALVLSVLVVLGIVLTDMAALREEKGDAMELSMTSYFDSLARRDAAAADGPRNSLQLALMQAGAVPSLSLAREEVSEESSEALGGGLEDARRGAARRLAPPSTGVQTQPRRSEASDIAADMKDMLRSGCHPPLARALVHECALCLCLVISHALAHTFSPPCALYQHKAALRERKSSCEFARQRRSAARDAGHEEYRQDPHVR